jgi:hypothetical protein
MERVDIDIVGPLPNTQVVTVTYIGGSAVVESTTYESKSESKTFKSEYESKALAKFQVQTFQVRVQVRNDKVYV